MRDREFRWVLILLLTAGITGTVTAQTPVPTNNTAVESPSLPPGGTEAAAPLKSAGAVVMPKQELAPAQAKNTKKAIAGNGVVYKKPVQFDRAERLETMRYQHLWLAYSFIWLFVFLFIWRTWKLNNQTTAELAIVRSKLAALEAKDGDT